MILANFVQFVEDAPTDAGLQSVAAKMCDLFGLWSLEKHLHIFYEGGGITV